ncbi:hypothetical protein F5050DRAFT_1713641 [Lentinula boryana]|uniref:Uncharacterized protein n=1 Tax=Lentinula boryana TaxID=40481 RepID=A0ABQ8Q7M7_9AGAR|nr:hypothetical protein F5050DRAFT_1713641 [Lentinula boryana]
MVDLQLLIGIGLLYGLLLHSWKLGRWYLLKYYSVICGGSITGLLAARVCSDFFVIIVEPEEWLTSEDDARRSGWEQEQKRFLALFYKGLRELFPDLDEQCQYLDIAIYPADRNMNFAGTPIPAPLSDLGDLYEIRKADGRIEELDASLVVGYGSSTEVHPDRKQKLSLQDTKISFNQKLQYSTLTCKVSPDIFSKLSLPNLENGFVEDGTKRGRRIFGISQGNDNRVMLFAGQSSDETVKFDSIHAMRELVPDLKMYKDPMPQWVFKTLDILEESQPEILYYYVSCHDNRRQYHDNQGCTKALLGAVVLHAALSSAISHQELPADFSKRFFKDNFNKTNSFWQITRMLDYGIPCTTPLPGEDLRSGSLIRWYLRKILILGTKDAQAARVCWDRANGLGTSIDIFHPWLVLKVFSSAII